MKQITYLSGFILLIIFFIACSKKTTAISQTTTDQKLMGTWKWVRSSGGFANQTRTPESIGENRSLQFANDHQYFIYKNESIISFGTYAIETRQCIHDHTNKPWINFSSPNDNDQMIEKMEETNLELSDEVYDGFDHFYTKAK